MKHSEGTHILGGEQFREDVQKKINAGPEVPRVQKYFSRCSLNDIKAAEATRGAWMTAAYQDYHYTMREIADFEMVHYSLVSKIIKAWEGQ